MSDGTREPPWDDWPEAGPDDWMPCPACWNYDGGCPFCGHGMVPKYGFNWPGYHERRRRVAAGSPGEETTT